MTDMHSHLIYGVDDGVKSLEEAVTVISDMAKSGYKNLIITPHYIKDSSYANPRSDNEIRLRTIKEELKKRNIDINLYLGNEIFINDDILELLDSDLICSLNNTKYLLIELPLSGYYDGYLEVFKCLISKGYKIILAHPERYLSFQEDYNKILELESIGVLFQGDLESIIDKYGSDAKGTFVRMLSENKFSYLATDIHHKKHEYADWVVARAMILKYIEEKELEDLIVNNPNKLVDSM